MHLDLVYSSFDAIQFMYENISEIINMRQIYHLTIHGQIFADPLIRILLVLSTLDSLQICSLNVLQFRSPSNDDESRFSSISSKIRIIKVNLTIMNHIKEIYFLLQICPNLIYLRVEYIKNIDVKLFVRLILLKMKTQHQSKLQLLCFQIPAADDQMIEQLDQMIDDQKLLIDYTIKHVFDFIYLQWDRKE